MLTITQDSELSCVIHRVVILTRFIVTQVKYEQKVQECRRSQEEVC